MIEPHYLAQHASTTVYLGHLDELHYVSTAAVICGSDALENQHSSFETTREQLSKKENAILTGKGLRPVRSLECKLTSCEKNQNTECQSEHNKGMRPG